MFYTSEHSEARSGSTTQRKILDVRTTFPGNYCPSPFPRDGTGPPEERKFLTKGNLKKYPVIRTRRVQRLFDKKVLLKEKKVSKDYSGL